MTGICRNLAMAAAIFLLPVMAQADTAAGAPPDHQLDRLSQQLEQIRHNLDRPWYWRSQLPKARSELDRIDSRAEELGNAAERQAKKKQELLDSLGAAPKKGETEAPDIARRRKQLELQLQRYDSNVKHAKLVRTSVGELRDEITARSNRLKASALLHRDSVLLDPGQWQAAVEDVRRSIVGLPALRRAGAGLSPGATAFLLFLGLLLYVPPRLMLVGRIQRAKVGGGGTRFDVFRLIGRSLLLNMALPAAAIAGLLVLLAYGVIAQVDALLLGSAVLTVGGVVWAATLIGAVPHLTPRFGTVGSAAAKRITRPAIVLASCAGLYFFLQWAAQALAGTPSVFPMLSFALSVISAVAVAMLVSRGAIRRRRSRPRRPHKRPRVMIPTLVWAGAAALLIDPVIHLAGYRALAEWLYGGVVGTALLFGLLWYLSAFVHEAAPLAIRRWLRPVSVFGMGRPLPRTRSRRIGFLLSMVAGAAIWIVGLAALPLFWGVDSAQLLGWGTAAFSGIKVGDVTLSIRAVALALAGIAVVLLLTRLLQAMLEDRVFPEIEADVGVQTALKSGVGYLGLAIAGLVGLLALNVNLSSLAIVFGALSVGIGFGLQAIVGNFISGLIMLVERPIKVGDWVVVHGEEGIVKRISVRATEIQTFERSSVLIPNSELISGTVTNWTFKDVTGRIDIVVGVDYDSDVDAVRELMLEVAREHPDVLSDPAPRAVLRDLGDSGLIFELWSYVNVAGASDKLAVESEIRVALFKALKAAGIVIPYPRQDVTVLPPKAATADAHGAA